MRLRCQGFEYWKFVPKKVPFTALLTLLHFLGVGKVYFLDGLTIFGLNVSFFEKLPLYVSYRLKITPVVHLKIFEALVVQFLEGIFWCLSPPKKMLCTSEPL